MTGHLDYNPCPSCRRPIRWQRAGSGKKTPFNTDGTSHWSTCPGAIQERLRANVARDTEKLAAWTNAAKDRRP